MYAYEQLKKMYSPFVHCNQDKFPEYRKWLEHYAFDVTMVSPTASGVLDNNSFVYMGFLEIGQTEFYITHDLQGMGVFPVLGDPVPGQYQVYIQKGLKS